MTQIHRIDEAGWSVGWAVTESSGVKIYLADFRGRRVLWEAALPYVTIDHQAEVDPDDGGAVAHGPWWSPLGWRTIQGGVRATALRGGFELAADFVSGPYRYTQLWRFHDDGRLEPWLTLHGPGIHDAHTYHAHWRFDFDVDGARHDTLEYWEEGKWVRAAEEMYLPFRGETSPEGYAWRQLDLGSGATVNLRPHHAEDAELFAVRYHAGEWPPLTPRQSPSGQSFPAAYIGNESLDSVDVTLWYVTHVPYGQGFPFTTGPWIRVERP